MPKKSPKKRGKLTKTQTKHIRDGLKKAGFGDLAIQAIHLSPSGPDDAVASNCHSVQLPDGRWVIVC